MAYADYEFYTGTYFGTAISPEDFQRLSDRASRYIDAATMHRAHSASGDAHEAVQMATCAMAEIEQDEAKMNARTYSIDKAVTSESVGSWSRSFGTQSASGTEIQLLYARKTEVLNICLAPFGLMRWRACR